MHNRDRPAGLGGLPEAAQRDYITCEVRAPFSGITEPLPKQLMASPFPLTQIKHRKSSTVLKKEEMKPHHAASNDVTALRVGAAHPGKNLTPNYAFFSHSTC